MGFNKCYLHSVDKMQEIISEYGVDHFIKLYRKCDCFIGSSESIKFLNETMENETRAPEPGKFDGHLPGQE